jgi:hypothetical protein
VAHDVVIDAVEQPYLRPDDDLAGLLEIQELPRGWSTSANARPAQAGGVWPSARTPRARLALLGLSLALLAIGMGATPTLAATSFVATFKETTIPQPCPDDLPMGAFCFVGQGTGPVTPPGGQGTENFVGFVDLAKADPTTHCAPDFNAVSITTSRGVLILITQGSGCPTSQTTSVDNGTWTAIGGTGIFANAQGSGSVSSAATFNPNGTISSTTTYGGTLTLG